MRTREKKCVNRDNTYLFYRGVPVTRASRSSVFVRFTIFTSRPSETISHPHHTLWGFLLSPPPLPFAAGGRCNCGNLSRWSVFEFRSPKIYCCRIIPGFANYCIYPRFNGPGRPGPANRPDEYIYYDIIIIIITFHHHRNTRGSAQCRNPLA